MVKKVKLGIDKNAKTAEATDEQAFVLPVEEVLATFDAEYRSRCGGALRASREKLGLTTQVIASRLRLSAKQIEALEADNFAALPEATIVKGFIRNYAKQLKIDAGPLLDAYNVIVPEKAPQSFTLHPSANMKVTNYEKPNIARLALIALAAVLGIGTWLFYQHYVQKPNPVLPTAELVQPDVAEALPEVALPAAERSADETVTQLTLPGTETSSATSPDALATAVTPPVAPATPTAAAIDVPTAPLAPQLPAQTDAVQAESTETGLGMVKLELNASQETWVNVTDASGKEIYSKTLFAGNREVISGKPPLNLTVGNALGATLEVNGKAVDLAPHTRTNIAHVKVD